MWFSGSRPTPARLRVTGSWSLGVLCLAAVCMLLKLWIASSTYGTDDVRYWSEFMQGVDDHGPVGIYGTDSFEAPYNHPPLVGWILLVLSKLVALGVPGPLVIRAPAIVADFFAALVLFRLVRHRTSTRTAGIAASLFAVSPLLFVISGFHGNTDPVFVLLVLVAGHSLLVSRNGVLAGLAIGLAISVKLTPVVMLPLLVVFAARGGRRFLAAFLGGAAAALLVWLPVIVLRGPELVSEVLSYSGAGPRQWGLTWFAYELGVSYDTAFALGDRLRFVSVAVAALVPAAMAATRRVEPIALLGLPLCLFLLLSPTFGYQYLTWALAPAFLLAPTFLAALYSFGSGLSVLLVYSSWNHAPPWDWYEATSGAAPHDYVRVLTATWVVLALVCLSSARLLRRARYEHGRSSLAATTLDGRPAPAKVERRLVSRAAD